jgi:hypothetical protein
MKTTIIQNEASEKRTFHLSKYFTIENVSYSKKGYTFFRVSNAFTIPDGALEFYPSTMMRELGCSRSVSGCFYLYGIYVFEKSASDGVSNTWTATRKSVKITIEVIDEQ